CCHIPSIGPLMGTSSRMDNLLETLATARMLPPCRIGTPGPINVQGAATMHSTSLGCRAWRAPRGAFTSTSKAGSSPAPPATRSSPSSDGACSARACCEMADLQPELIANRWVAPEMSFDGAVVRVRVGISVEQRGELLGNAVAVQLLAAAETLAQLSAPV